MLSFAHAKFYYEPYPIAVAQPIMPPETYQAMVEAFPPVELCRHRQRKGTDKYYLNETQTKQKYLEFVNGHEVWREFHRYVKSEAFLRSVMDLLRDHNVDLGFFRARPSLYRRCRTALGDVVKRGRWPEFPLGLYGRFEFSMMPADGGGILPHTDDPKKIVTIVLYMPEDGEWDRAWGGGLEVSRPKDPTQSFNFINRKLDYADVEEVRTFDYAPNLGIIFIKTFNSWHSVRPMQGAGAQALRKTLTINIETN